MKKSLKLSLISILTVLLAFCALISLNVTNVKAESGISTASFKLLDGAYMRDATPKGIRFEAGISQADKDSLPENATFGMLITLDSYLGNQELTHEADINVVDIPTSVWLSTSASKVGEGYLGYYSTLVGGTENNSTDMESEYYSSIFVARGYINIDGQYIYTPNTVERSIAGVAEMAIEAGAETDYAQEIVEASKKITFNIDNQNGEIIERQVVVGSILNENDVPETPIKEGYAFLGYYKDVECTEEFKFSGILKQDTTIYAGWKFLFTYTGTEELTITGYLGTDTNVIIPAEKDGVPITKIGSNAFENCSSLESVNIPATLTGVVHDAFFGCSNLTKVNYDGTIEQWVMISFDNLFSNPLFYAKHLYIKGEELVQAKLTTATKISDFSFINCINLKSLDLSKGVKSIGMDALFGCIGLESINLSSSLTKIGNVAFRDCNALTKVNFTGSIEEWAMIEFGSESNPVSYAKKLYINDVEIADVKLTNIAKISKFAFYNCESLTSIEISSSVTSIGSSAFYGCSNLTTATFGENSKLESIGTNVFYNCSSLESIDIPSNVTSIGSSAFYGCSNLTTATFGENSKLESIGTNVFYNCSSLESIEIPSGVTSIEHYTFSMCSKLLKVIFSNESQLRSIGSQAFLGCENLENIDLPEKVTTISGGAFSRCKSLTSISLPSSLVNIGDSVFRNCTALTKVNYTGNVEQWVNIAFSTAQSNPVYYAKKLYINDVEIADVKLTNIAKISDYAFYNCESLKSIEIPSNIINIGGGVFSGCSNLESIEIPSNVTSIGSEAFAYCSSLESIEIPSNVTSIGYYAFKECIGLTEIKYNAIECSDLDGYNNEVFANAGKNTNGIKVIIGSNVKRIPEYLFYPSNSLRPKITSVTVEANSVCESIGDNAFDGCSDLESIEIPSSVTSIGDNAFNGCSNLKTVTFNGTCEQWNAISKGSYWNNSTGSYTIYCTDGTIAKS